MGFFEFRNHERTLEIGLGLCPEMTGKGKGLEFVMAGLSFGCTSFDANTAVPFVASFNVRAIKVYKKAGFVSNGTSIRKIGGKDYEFLKMEKSG